MYIHFHIYCNSLLPYGSTLLVPSTFVFVDYNKHCYIYTIIHCIPINIFQVTAGLAPQFFYVYL